MSKKPEAYKMKTRSREGMMAEIADLTTVRVDHYDPYLLCFNVKCYSVDLELPDMLKRYREQEGDPAYTHDHDWLREVKEKYDEVEEHLFNWGVEGARASFVGYGDGMQFDTFRTLWDGTEVDVEYAFIGRSGGWLAITKFNGQSFDQRGTDLEECLRDMEYSDLMKLYQLILMVKDACKRENVKAEIEHMATFDFFANVCAGIHQPDALQGHLFETETEEAILAGTA